ncbi:MAG: MFS transporter [Candidatus Binatus sp.]|uniref:MFS transporter n=1 Tax=Candidatus Binatus sp. TaxID=2811406 RepID=UPI00271E8258|nr:MFS transporter [Candidatus Binatus sp.]MDO8434355.1 MFS transporter [Candidatus Binatus sp.]
MKNLPLAQEEAAASESNSSAQGFFYGWVIVACAFTILAIAYGIQFSFGVFMPFISADTGWDRGSLSVPYSLYVFVYGLLGVVSGRLTDSLGPRIVLTVGGCLLGAGVILMGQVHTLWQLYIVLGLIAAAGMSAAYVPCNATVVRWFTVKRGLAISITSSGSSFGMFLFPPIATALIGAYGWRRSYVILGLLAIAVFAGCASFIVRDPEDIGLHPDGLAPREPQPGDEVRDLSFSDDWTLAEAQRTSTFWLLNVIFTLTWLVVFMPMVHIVPFAVDIGISHFLAAMTISIIGFAGFAGRLAIGTISDRLGRLPTLGLCLFLQALAFFGFAMSSALPLLYVAAAVFGFSYGGVTSLFPALVGDFFGRIAIGAIVGFIFAVAGSSAAFGPLIAGYLYDATKSYHAAFVLSAALNLAALLLVFALKKPGRATS